jgi:EmrB/QacA subfamily drug resistance transporter
MNATDKVKKWSILLIVVISTFMCTLDSSIINVALPEMAHALHVTTSDIQLVATSYLIVISAIVLVFGRLGDMFGKTTMFKLGLGIFTIGSLLCSIATSFPLLILSRIIQAIGAAGTMANNQGIITEAFPYEERGKALGLLGTFVALGALVGPGLGGFIIGSFSWHFIFLINVPIGLIALVLAIKFLPNHTARKKETLDFLGSLLFLFTIVPLFVSLNEGMNRGFSDPYVLGGFLIAIIAFLLFIRREQNAYPPLIKLDIFGNKLFSLSIFCAFVTFVAMFCSNIILPFYLQDVMSFSPEHAGMILMIYPLILSVVAPFSGYLSDRIGSEILTFIGLLCASSGLFLMSLLNEHSSAFIMVLFIAIMSAGMGLFQAPNNSLIMSTVPMSQLGIAGSINALVRNLGMVCGIDLATTLLYGMMSLKTGYHVTDYIPGQNDVFIFGMRVVYIAAGSISLIGAILTFIRLQRKVSSDKF